MKKLKSIADVIDILGGTVKAAEVLGVRSNRISNWKAAGIFPNNAQIAFKITDLCHGFGYEVDRSLFGQEVE